MSTMADDEQTTEIDPDTLAAAQAMEAGDSQGDLRVLTGKDILARMGVAPDSTSEK
jgi:hypothetical protein